MMLRNVIIETTRRCNMSCDHCLRGKAQPIDMMHRYITSLCRQLEHGDISSLTFSGGEPSLSHAVKIINFTLQELKNHQITLGSFYIATNGLAISEEFVMACLRLYSYSDNKDMCCVQVSNDYFHAEEDKYNTELLDGLSFFSRKYSEEATHDYTCINEGNYKEFFDDSNRKPQVTEISTRSDFTDECEIYLNCHGNIVNGCDWSYDSQPLHALCYINDLASYIANLPEED